MTEIERIAEKYFEPLPMPVDGEVIDIDHDFRESCKAALREFGELACKAARSACCTPHPNSSSDGYYRCCGYDIEKAIRKLMEIEAGK